jgi:hypothetical protein
MSDLWPASPYRPPHIHRPAGRSRRIESSSIALLCALPASLTEQKGANA